ncbi:hypothetical protein BJ742DRAFT_779733 [Cladochytrium replicatum]|nr:hypothetical protein BJ742DRAFT_779733 [Cladochytrium replicatum]
MRCPVTKIKLSDNMHGQSSSRLLTALFSALLFADLSSSVAIHRCQPTTEAPPRVPMRSRRLSTLQFTPTSPGPVRTGFALSSVESSSLASDTITGRHSTRPILRRSDLCVRNQFEDVNVAVQARKERRGGHVFEFYGAGVPPRENGGVTVIAGAVDGADGVFEWEAGTR